MTTATLHHVIDGPADAPVLVLGPSLGTDLHLFDAQAAALSDQYRVVRFDLRGHGHSAVVAGPTTIADLSGDVLALLDQLGVATFHYAGVSIGGAIGLHLAVTAPTRLTTLTIIASAARFADPPSWPLRAAKVRAEGTGFLVPSRTGAWFTLEFAAQHPDEAGRLLAMLRDTPPEGYAAACDAIAAFDIRDRLREITTPTLVIAGAEDPATPLPMVRAIADGIEGAAFLSIPRTSHLVSAEAPDAVSDAIRGHLRSRD
jgi:3-oxoadipate enol-lactonase